MYFIKEKNTLVGLFHQAFTVAVCTGVGAAHNAKEMRHQQLRIARVIGAVETDKGRICW